VLLAPPPIVERVHDAVLLYPPDTVEQSPDAVLFEPPLIVAQVPVAEFEAPLNAAFNSSGVDLNVVPAFTIGIEALAKSMLPDCIGSNWDIFFVAMVLVYVLIINMCKISYYSRINSKLSSVNSISLFSVVSSVKSTDGGVEPPLDWTSLVNLEFLVFWLKI